MKSATITEVKNQLSAIIDRVKAGETVIVTDRVSPWRRSSLFAPMATTEPGWSVSSGAASFDGIEATASRYRAHCRCPGRVPSMPSSTSAVPVDEVLDSSALVPLFVQESTSTSVAETYAGDPAVVALVGHTAGVHLGPGRDSNGTAR